MSIEKVRVLHKLLPVVESSKVVTVPQWMWEFSSYLLHSAAAADNLSFAMMTNSAFQVPNKSKPFVLAPHSHFFSMGMTKPEVQVDYIEAMGADSVRFRTHQLMINEIDFERRNRDGWIVRSGHMAEDNGKGVALVDVFTASHQYLPVEILFLRTLLQAGILPVSALGKPILNIEKTVFTDDE